MRKLTIILTLFILTFGATVNASVTLQTTAGNLNVRDAPTGNVIDKLPYDSQVTGLELNADGSWVKIQYGETIGWVSTQYVSGDLSTLTLGQSDTETTVVSPPPPSGIESLIASNPNQLNARTGASTSARLITTLDAGTQIVPNARTDNWLRFDWQGQLAWVADWLLDVQGDVSSLPYVIADFGMCDGRNYVGGSSGVAVNNDNPGDNNQVSETYFPSQTGCAVQLDYNITGWVAFWTKVNGMNMSGYNHLTFAARTSGQPIQIKVEIKQGQEQFSIAYVGGIHSGWQQYSVDLNALGSVEWASPLNGRNNIRELVFVIERANASDSGTLFIDNIMLHR